MKKGDLDNLSRLFNPRSIAIVGATEDEKKIGNIVIKNLEKSGYKKEVFLINPHLPKIGNYASFAAYSDLKTVPDLAIIATPAVTVPSIVKEVGKKGTKYAVIFSAGFKELGEDGKKLQEDLLNAAQEGGVNILGPNCLGFVNSEANINATFGAVEDRTGNLRVISQSGAIATSMFDWAAGAGIGFSQFVTIGNKVGIDENDLLSFWQDAKSVKKIEPGLSKHFPVGMYLESVSGGKEFVRIIRELSKSEPVVVLKPGRSKASGHAMLSHTGALAGDDRIFSAAVEEAGAIRADGLEDFFDLLKAFAWENAPSGNRVAIISNAGGPAVVAADFLESSGLELAKLKKSTESKLRKVLPRESAYRNPVDVLGDADVSRYRAALEAVLSESGVDAVLVILTPQAMTEVAETARAITELSAKHNKTVVCSFMGSGQIEAGVQILDEAKIPTFLYPERAVVTLGKMAAWKKSAGVKNKAASLKTHLTPSSLSRISNYLEKIAKERQVMSGYETAEILAEAGVRLPKYSLVGSFEDAKEFVHRFEFPVALKVTAGEMIHKTDLGGVFPKIETDDQLAIAFKKLKTVCVGLQKKKIDAAIMIQKNISGGVEALVGFKRDETFGKVALVGMGGIFAELNKDQKIIILPNTEAKIREILLSSNLGKVLSGFRTGKKYAIEKLIRMIMIGDELMEKCGIINEMEMNPVIITEDDAFAVDGRARLII